MTEFGSYALALAWALSLIGLLSGLYAGRTGSQPWYLTTRNATILVCVCSGIALGTLGWMFLHDDYSNQYVWQYSNREMDAIYKFTAIWGGMDGSMLLWAFFLTISSALVALQSINQSRALMPWVLAVANSSSLFFLTVVTFLTNPFRYIKAPFIPPDGNGLNPLLQNPYMAIHPPMLYAGFTTFAIPFAFCIGALLANQVNNEWIRLTRRWTIIAFAFLTTGIILGGHWAYIELGWGGFWAWDPVENASFLPWLTGTAFLHSVMVQERKNMLKSWNVWLIILTYGLTVFGTFLTRSGVVQSVHAFASTDIGWVFLLYLGILFAIGVLTTWTRRVELRSERSIESLLSRETAFLVNNLLFLGIGFATLWGVMFPVFSEWLTGTKQAVGVPFYNAVNIPIFMLLIFLMGVGPLVAWRKATFRSVLSAFISPALTGCAVGCFLIWGGITSFWPVLSYSLCTFVLMTIMGELHRGLKVQRAARGDKAVPIGHDLSSLFRRHTTRYGGYCVHFGVLVVTVAITASMAHKIEREFTLRVGEQYQIGRYALTLDSLEQHDGSNYSALIAKLQVHVQGTDTLYATLRPEMRVYTRNQEPTSEVALAMNLREDLYMVLTGVIDQGERAAFKVFINPLQIWLWFGGMIMLGGTIIVLFPRIREPIRAEPLGDEKAVSVGVRL